MLLFIYILCLVAIIFFMLIRPQQKRKKEHAQLISSLQSGTEILTIGGLFGTVSAISEDRITITVKSGTELEFDKLAIAKVISNPNEGGIS